MSVKREKGDKEGSEHLKEFAEIYSQLSRWGRFQVDLYLRWHMIRRRWGKVIWDWLVFQWELGEKVKERNTKHAGP